MRHQQPLTNSLAPIVQKHLFLLPHLSLSVLSTKYLSFPKTRTKRYNGIQIYRIPSLSRLRNLTPSKSTVPKLPMLVMSRQSNGRTRSTPHIPHSRFWRLRSTLQRRRIPRQRSQQEPHRLRRRAQSLGG